MSERYWHILNGELPNTYFKHLACIKVEYTIADLVRGGNTIAFSNAVINYDFNFDDDIYHADILLKVIKNITDEDRTYLTLLGLELKEEVRPKYVAFLAEIISSTKPCLATHDDFRRLFYRSEMDIE